MLFHSTKKSKEKKEIVVKKEVEELKLECKNNDELTNVYQLGSLKVGNIYVLKNPESYGPYIDTIKDGRRRVYTTNQPPKIVSIYTKESIMDEDGENEYEGDYNGTYMINEIQYECQQYLEKSERRSGSPKYTMGIFVYLQPILSEIPSDKLLRISYELQTSEGGPKHKGWRGNTRNTYKDFTKQFNIHENSLRKTASRTASRTAKKRNRSVNMSGMKMTKTPRNGGKSKTLKKTQKKKKKESFAIGGMKEQDKEFFKKKKEKVEEKKGIANLFGFGLSPERDPRNMISSDAAKEDPHRIKPMQNRFNQQLKDEGDYMDAEAAGLTFN